MKIGIDLGGTKTEGILIEDNGTELKRDRISTEKNYKGTIEGIVSIVKNFEKKFGNTSSIGIGMPGAIASDSALVKNANSIWLNGQPLKKDLQIYRVLQKPIRDLILVGHQGWKVNGWKLQINENPPKLSENPSPPLI